MVSQQEGMAQGTTGRSHWTKDEMTSRVRVFARAKPADKLEIVKSLQRQGLVCAMRPGCANGWVGGFKARNGLEWLELVGLKFQGLGKG